MSYHSGGLFSNYDGFLVHHLSVLVHALEDVNTRGKFVHILAQQGLSVHVDDSDDLNDFLILDNVFIDVSALTHDAANADVLAVENACVVVSPYIDILSIGEALN